MQNLKFILFFLFTYIIINSFDFALAQNVNATPFISQNNQLRNNENTNDLTFTEKTSTQNSPFQFNDGIWLNTTDTFYQDIYHRVIKEPVSSIFDDDMRVWGNLTFAGKNSVYIRVKDDYTFYHVTSNYTGPAGGSDNDGPHLDMGYVSLASDTAELKIGRQYLSVGNGIAYSDINDGIRVRKVIHHWILKGFAAQSDPHETDIDSSIPGYDKDANKRNFYAVEAAYTGIPKFIPFVYYLVQRDHSSPNPSDESQNFRYNSQYLGLGFNGFVGNLNYRFEGIQENGIDFNDATTNDTIPLVKDKIKAEALDIEIKYKFQTLFHPVSGAEFAFGSGDKNRTSPTNTIGGNNNPIDTNFLYYGNFYGGYALQPRLSNLLIYKLEQSFNPFEGCKIFKDLTIGGKYFIYVKDKSSAGISDIEALQDHSFVGTEYDVYTNWAINQHFSIMLRYGEFTPGNAFASDAKADSKYILLGTTIAY